MCEALKPQVTGYLVKLWIMNLLIYKYASVLSSTDSPASFRLTRGRNLRHNGTIFSEFQAPGSGPVSAGFNIEPGARVIIRAL
jgi:hypothetical protein